LKVLNSPQEVSFPARVEMVYLKCPKCRDGYLMYAADDPIMTYSTSSNSILFHHVCNVCGNEVKISERYPFQRIIVKDLLPKDMEVN